MKHIANVALMLNLGIAGIYAQQRPVKMTISGTAAPSTIVLQQGAAGTGEYHFDGNGTLGPFTFRAFTASAPSQQPIGSTCAIYGSVVAGAGVFRLQDGSLLMVNSAQGTDCIQFTATGPVAHCVRIFKIAGGTGRFQNVSPSGSITLNEALVPVLSDDSGNPVFFAVTGTGTVSGVAIE